MAIGFSGEFPPARFNMARYCLGPSAHRPLEKPGLIVLANSGENATPTAFSYATLDQSVRRIAGALRADGHTPGDRIMIRLGNTSDFALLFFGAIAAGLTALPTSSQLTEREAAFIADDADVHAIAVTTEIAEHISSSGRRIYSAADIHAMARSGPLADYANTDANDPAFLIYTSGTSGNPKGVLHAQRSAWGRRPMYRDWYDISGEDRVLHAGAFNWTYTLGTGLTDPWANGATAIINTQPREAAAWPSLMRDTGATIFAAVPSLYRQILKYAPNGPIDTGTLRHGLTAGEQLPDSVATAWQLRTGTVLHEALGMSEISTYISASPRNPARPGTVGRPQTGRSVAILPVDGGVAPLPAGEIGRLAVHRSDPGMMLDYWRRPEESAEVYIGDWFCGGDLASMDADGFITHHGRGDDVMNAFGYRVSPVEVEQTLSQCSGVSEIAVTDITIRDGVSIIAAFIVPEEEQDPREALNAHAQSALANYKRPKEFFLVPELPRTANGKIRRKALQDVFNAMIPIGQ